MLTIGKQYTTALGREMLKIITLTNLKTECLKSIIQNDDAIGNTRHIRQITP